MTREEMVKKVSIAQYLTKEELVELVKELYKDRQYWKERFEKLEFEYDMTCYEHGIPKSYSY